MPNAHLLADEIGEFVQETEEFMFNLWAGDWSRSSGAETYQGYAKEFLDKWGLADNEATDSISSDKGDK